MKKIISKLSEKGPIGLAMHLMRSRFQIPMQRFLERMFREQWLHSYSQYAEDLILDYLLNNQATGSYIDIGANDPDHFNNTKRF